MKKVQSKVLTLFCVCLMALPVSSFASGWGNNDNCNDVPLDGGISLLAAAGVGYGVKKVAERKKRAQEEKQK
jgi:hypothetical protein